MDVLDNNNNNNFSINLVKSTRNNKIDIDTGFSKTI